MSQPLILIVDDEPSIRQTLSRALELEGFRTQSADSLAAARERLAVQAPAAVLLDLRLPDGSGHDLLETLSASEDGGPPVLVMSGHGTIDDAVRALHRGARDFLEKPVGQDRLLVSLNNALELDRLQRWNRDLRAELGLDGVDRIVGESAPIQRLKAQILRVAPSEGRVLLTGENGSGKELVARAIHTHSARASAPFVSINCGAVPAELIESELFGHEKGAFTGATQRHQGKFERADGGTLFLDEIGDMPAAMQVKLLRVLQTGELERVGGTQSLRVDVRVVAATHRDLEARIADDRFREDLYYRLNVVPLHVPPLRERREDVPMLAERFVAEASPRNHRDSVEFAPDALRRLAQHDYPGNVRELRNLVERIVILAEPGRRTLDASDVEPFMPRSGREALGYRPGAKLSELVTEAERAIVETALEVHGHSIPDTARALGVERSNFHKKLRALGLK